MTNAKTINWAPALRTWQPSERVAARKAAGQTGCDYLGGNLVATDECIVEVVWMNRKHTGFIAREAACPDID